MELTFEMIKDWGGDELFEEALAKVKAGAVVKADIYGDTVVGVYAREGGPITCEFTVHPNNYVESDCPCRMNKRYNMICVHVIALAISIAQRLSDPMRQQRYIEERRHAERIEKALESTFLRSPKGTPAKLLIELPADYIDQFEKGAVTLRAIVLVGKPGKPTFLEKLSKDTPLSFSEDDDIVIDVLEDMQEGGLASTMTLNRIDFLGLLDVYRGREFYLAGSKSQIKVNQKAAPFFIYASLDRTTGEIHLEPKARLEDTSDSPIKFISELEKSFAICGLTITPLKPTLPLQYQSLYKEAITIPRDAIFFFFERELELIQSKVPVEFEDGLSPDCFTHTPGTPRFVLTLTGSLDYVQAELEAVYGDKSFPAQSAVISTPLHQPDPDDFYNFFDRNLPLEQRALTRLKSAGFFGLGGYGLTRVEGRRKILNLLSGFVPPLRRLGWTVNVTDKLGKLFDEAEMVIPVVDIDTKTTNQGWFDIGMDFQLSNRQIVPQAIVQQALNKGENFVDINGKTLLIDGDAIESMRSIFRDCESRPSSKPGHFQMPSVYAPYVRSSLMALDGVDSESPIDWRAQADRFNREEPMKAESLGSLENTLRPYQKTGVYWMRFLENTGFCGILADEMGLGKTLQTLTWLSLERSNKETQRSPALVVAPTSLVENWRREAEKFTPWRKCIVMHGPDRHERWKDIPNADIVITSYALLRRDMEHYEEQTFSVAVLDEAQHIKNRSTQNSKAAKQIRAKAKLVLTGTPIENGVADLWSIMDFLMPGYLGEYKSFKTAYESPIAAGGIGAEEAQERLHKKLRPFLLRRLKKDVAQDLPDKILNVSYSSLEEDQGKVYNGLHEVYRQKILQMAALGNFGKCKIEILSMLMRLRQACCHPGLLPDDMRSGIAADASSGKVAQFLDILDEAIDGGHRMLVFSQFVEMLQILKRTLDSRGVKYCYLDGSTKDRMGECRRFNQDNTIPVFLISLKAGGTGLNLTGADMVIHFDPWWNPAVEDQATDRAHRIGQKRTVLSIKLIAEGTIEEKVLELQQKKQAIIEATVGTNDSSIMQSLTWDDIKELFS